MLIASFMILYRYRCLHARSVNIRVSVAKLSANTGQKRLPVGIGMLTN